MKIHVISNILGVILGSLELTNAARYEAKLDFSGSEDVAAISGDLSVFLIQHRRQHLQCQILPVGQVQLSCVDYVFLPVSFTIHPLHYAYLSDQALLV